ncbi:MAG: hypothetical protein ACR2GL_03010 [Thermoleophilaceae bacterium]
MTAAGRTRLEIGNRAELFLTTHFEPLWRAVQDSGPLRRRVNAGLINRAVDKMAPRPYPLTRTDWRRR